MMTHKNPYLGIKVFQCKKMFLFLFSYTEPRKKHLLRCFAVIVGLCIAINLGGFVLAFFAPSLALGLVSTECQSLLCLLGPNGAVYFVWRSAFGLSSSFLFCFVLSNIFFAFLGLINSLLGAAFFGQVFSIFVQKFTFYIY